MTSRNSSAARKPAAAALSVGQAEKPKSGSGGIGETIRTVVYALLIALVIRTVAVEPFNIPSGSMIPSLLIGDYLFVSKYAYGYSRHSLPFSPPLFEGRVFGSTPERGDVAVFKLPSDGQTDYIKRIIGLPGDKIQVVDGVLHMNGEAVKRERIGDYVPGDGPFKGRKYTQYRETLPNGVSHLIIEERGDTGVADNTPVYTVPPGHVFAMGDNRDNSQDSRFPDVSFIPIDNLVGRAEVIFFSLEEGTAFLELWEWPWALRFGRLFSAVE